MFGGNGMKLRWIKILKIGSWKFSSEVILGINVKERERRLGKDRLRRKKNIEGIIEKLRKREIGLVLKGKKEIEKMEMKEGSGWKKRESIKKREMKEKIGNIVIYIMIVEEILNVWKWKWGKIVKEWEEWSIRVRGDELKIIIKKIEKIIDEIGIKIEKEEEDGWSIGRGIVGKEIEKVIDDIEGKLWNGVDIDLERKSEKIGKKEVDKREGMFER